MTNKFKVGDKVKTVTESEYWKVDSLVKVVDVDEGDQILTYCVQLSEDEDDVWWGGKKDFELVASAYQAKRDDSGKPPLDYILYWPEAIKEIAFVCKHGETAYEKFNYKKGAPVSQYIRCALRHVTEFQNGTDLDVGPKGSHRHHLAHAAWNMLQALEVMLTPEMKEKFDDRYKGESK